MAVMRPPPRKDQILDVRVTAVSLLPVPFLDMPRGLLWLGTPQSQKVRVANGTQLEHEGLPQKHQLLGTPQQSRLRSVQCSFFRDLSGLSSLFWVASFLSVFLSVFFLLGCHLARSQLLGMPQ